MTWSCSVRKWSHVGIIFEKLLNKMEFVAKHTSALMGLIGGLVGGLVLLSAAVVSYYFLPFAIEKQLDNL